MRNKKIIVLVSVLVLLALGAYFGVRAYRSGAAESIEQPVVEPSRSEPLQESLPSAGEVPVEEPAPVEAPAPAKEPEAPKATPKKNAKPKEVATPKPAEELAVKAPAPEPKPAPVEEPVEEKPEPTPAPEPAPTPTPAPEPVKEPEPVKAPEPKKAEVAVDNNEIVASAEVMPKFKGGGLKEFQNYINENTKYPQVAAEMGIQGRVRVSFVVEKNGTVSNVKVVKSIDPLLDREAIRVVKSSPRWTPGQNGGVPVRVSQTASVLFVLR